VDAFAQVVRFCFVRHQREHGVHGQEIGQPAQRRKGFVRFLEGLELTFRGYRRAREIVARKVQDGWRWSGRRG
jgi:hypothetical protein